MSHTAADFRDSCRGGDLRAALHHIIGQGTRDLIAATDAQGVRRMVRTSSIAVLGGPRGATINETMVRRGLERHDRHRSTVGSVAKVMDVLDAHPDMWAAMALPGWVHGPGDAGPTKAGRTTIDFVTG